MGLSHSPRIVTNGLVFAVDAKNPKSYPGSGTSCTSLVDSSIVGTLTDITYNSEGSFVFNGTSSFANFGNPTALQLNTNITLESWAMLSAAATGQIVNKNGNTGYRYRFLSTQGVQFLAPGATNNNGTASNRIGLNTWNHIVVTGDSTGLKIYVNGVYASNIDNTTAMNLGTGANSADFELGYVSQFGNKEYLNGKIATVNVYNRALSATEIQQNFNALRGRFGL